MLSRLKPCPFCGSDNIHFSPRSEITVHGGGTSPAIVISCKDCPAEMVVNDQDVTPAEVIQFWNSRQA